MHDISWLYGSSKALPNKRVFRLGLATTHGLDEGSVRHAMDHGVNLFFWTPFRNSLKNPLRDAIAKRREDVCVVAYINLGWFGWRGQYAADGLLKALNTDYIDVLLLGWVGVTAAWNRSVEEAFVKLRESGKARAIGVSIHDRPRAGKLAEASPLDLLMIRYNAAHPGAEGDIFPKLHDGKPTILAYTGTAWRKLLKRPKGWEGNVMTAGDCYRFQLSSPHVDLALTSPASRAELEANLAALEKGPLSPEEDGWMRSFGRAVHG